MKAFNSTEEALSYLTAEEQKQEENKAKTGIHRLYMRPDSEATLVVLDDLLFPVREHEFKDARGWKKFETCIQEVEGECAGCESNLRSYLAFVTTVIHIDPKKKDGTEQKPTKKLMVVKQGASKTWLKRQKEMGTLKGKAFKLERSGDTKSPTTGSNIEFKKDADMEKVKSLAPEGIDKEEWVKPYDYKEIFKPKSPKELRAALGIGDPVGGEDDSDITKDEGEQKQQIDDLADQI